MGPSQTIGANEIHAAIERLAEGIVERHPRTRHLVLLGIANGGMELARRLARALAQAAGPVAVAGTIDVSFHRDDFGRHPIPKEFAPTHIPADVHGATVVLVDDVLFSGRTVKAALDELFDHGRPAKVELAVLVERSGRLLPVAADYRAIALDVAHDEKVVVRLDAKDPALDRIEVQPRPTAAKPAAKGRRPARRAQS
ncbi:MAG: bifunctional pyr operon transcriptional regulator/uracil phosphoribosyltransferase PyrR [Verrucomicrobia bacterium]|nr:bifunctional pyr operon transcriptional regulator/uracil phosphoribosyltransferase PyrR [Verrucomicrobiota bacterium]